MVHRNRKICSMRRLRCAVCPRTRILYSLGWSLYRVGWGKTSMVGQSESDDTFVSELKAKELTITVSSVLLFLFQWEHHGSLIFGIQIKISSDLLCPTILISPHPALPQYL